MNLLWVCDTLDRAPSEIVIMDNGAGTGTLTFLAKQAGFKKVVYNDIYETACKDAAVIGGAFDLELDAFISGDSDDIITYFDSAEYGCDAIVSRNVIEHIYDLNLYFATAAKIKGAPILSLATTANPTNPLVDIYTRGIQKRTELEGKASRWGKDRDSVKAYLQIRKELIAEKYPSAFDVKVIDQLALASRGMIKLDIFEMVDTYVESGNMPKEMDHRSNTCDPLTGNWTEHLLYESEYHTLAKNNGWALEIKNGFYNTNYAQKGLNLVTPIANLYIKYSGSFGRIAAPFIILQFKKA